MPTMATTLSKTLSLPSRFVSFAYHEITKVSFVAQNKSNTRADWFKIVFLLSS